MKDERGIDKWATVAAVGFLFFWSPFLLRGIWAVVGEDWPVGNTFLIAFLVAMVAGGSTRIGYDEAVKFEQRNMLKRARLDREPPA